jgi:hypothetical protein
MRLKRRTSAIVILVAVIVALTSAIFSEKPEPRSEGKTLSEWLAIYRRSGFPREAEPAVRAMGTNALPLLVEWTRYELPPWRQTLLNLATRPVEGKPLSEGKTVYGKSWIEGKSLSRAENAQLGFAILNTNATSSIPELEALMKDKRRPVVGLRAIYALSEIGCPAIPALTNALADPNQSSRVTIIEALYAIERHIPSFRDGCRGACLPALTRALNDANTEVRRQAKITLNNLDPQTNTSAPK